MKPDKIPFNRPYLSGRELDYITVAVNSYKISGDGDFTRKCHEYFEKAYGFNKVFLTTSCSDALEMAALLIDTKPGDEIIMPSFTFVSTANAFILKGARIVFADSYYNHPNIDADQLEKLVTPMTKAIVVVHYAGIACDMEKILAIADKHNIFLIEDAAHAIDSYYKNKQPLGSIGHMATFSFHETKNIISGEGGMIVINDDRFSKRAEIIREKGTNRSAFWRGEVDKYTWVDVGSSYLPSDMIAAFLYAQIENLEKIQEQRKRIWEIYYRGLIQLQENGKLELPSIPSFATNNGHMFYITCIDETERNSLILHLKESNIHAVFHYLSLHRSPFYTKFHGTRDLPNSDKFSACLLRLPFYFEITEMEQQRVIEAIYAFYYLRG